MSEWLKDYLTQMPVKDWLLFIGPIAGLIIGLISSVALKAIDARIAKKTSIRERMISGLELLHQAVSDTAIAGSNLGYRFIPTWSADNEAAWNDVRSLLLILQENIIRVRNLARIYTPDLAPKANPLIEASKKLLDGLADYHSGQLPHEHFKTLVTAVSFECKVFSDTVGDELAILLETKTKRQMSSSKPTQMK